jgi:hypothetical protein
MVLAGSGFPARRRVRLWRKPDGRGGHLAARLQPCGFAADANVVRRLIVFLAVLGWILSACVISEDIPSADALRSKAEDNLQLGATVEEIAAFLDSEGIDHSDEAIKTTEWSYSEKFGIPPGRWVYRGIVRGSRSSAVSLVFILDDNMRYERLVVIEREPL